jgi:PAS domain-containing protein
VLILAREFATRLATPMLIADADGSVVFYNEPAEDVLGVPYAEGGEITAAEWESTFQVEDADGKAMPLERMPAGIALLERRPAHGDVTITGRDGVKRALAVTAFPLFAREEEFIGAVAIFWQDDDAAA